MKNKNPLSGWLILDKPTGISSAKAVSKVKHLLRPKKIGHAGTLDPLASGILPLALGEATKTAGYMMDAGKSYSFTVEWGQQRDTDDSEGEAVATSDKRPSAEDIRNILPQFIGNINQMPPQYSALKIGGQRAYALAREGKKAELEPRNVRIDSLQVVKWDMGEGYQNKTSFICHCGKGTYIRAIARDMGEQMGCFGYITALRRLKVGKFEENHAISLEFLEEMVHKGDLSFLLPVESALDDIPALDITPSQAAQLQQGKSLSGPDVSSEIIWTRCDNQLVAICSADQGQIKPIRVFNLYNKGEDDVES